MNDFTTHNNDIVDEPTIDEPQEIILRKSQRQGKSTISNDYVVYLQESKFDLGIDNDPVSFSQAISNDNSNKWINAMKDELKSVKHNEI